MTETKQQEKISTDKEKWNLSKNNELYWINGWGEGYFFINSKGNIGIQPEKGGPKLDLYEIVQAMDKRGIEAPILIRFDGIIRDRIRKLNKAFDTAIKTFEYENRYQSAYPIKVNQQKHIVQAVKQSGSEHHIGLEVGSKPELLCALSHYSPEESLLLCNGYKDSEYIELALLSRKINIRSIVIIEQFYELQIVLDIAKKLNIEPEIGLRMKSASTGSGRWANSGGELAKFGLNTHEIMQCIHLLKKAGKSHWLKLLHFHVGSQITSIISIKETLREATRIYTEVAKLCPSMSFFDVGGGLGVDYEGAKTASHSSMNYTMEEYARDVVYAIKIACDEEELPHPVIISESGRAITAHHSILVTEVIDVAPMLDVVEKLPTPPSEQEIVNELCFVYETITPENCLESLHDAFHHRENILQLFIQGNLTLEERAYADRVFRHLIAKIRLLSQSLEFIPEDLKKIDEKFLDLYFCNFSVFQSLPDSWAIGQLFPAMPIHRLNERPSRRAHIVDVSCDSDGKIDQFVGKPNPARYIYLHEFKGEPYYLGIFLVGAYQEILGGLHNLFGDTNAVHIDIDEEGNWEFKHLIEGDTMSEVVNYMQYNAQEMIESIRLSIEKALKQKHLTYLESVKIKKTFKDALDNYTYLVV
ncbi:MAG: biosynthetic arginine decarboxylase [Parachlamydiales bacterium]|nr:biosynthetic arginine decarboxylase [Parachlamydiales bacterium]